MPIFPGAYVTLKIYDMVDSSLSYNLGYFRDINMRLSNELIDSTSLGSNGWKTVVNKVGNRQLTVSGNGFFSGREGEIILQSAAFSNGIAEYHLSFANSNVIKANFAIEEYQRLAYMDGLEEFSLTLISSGQVLLYD